MKYYLITGLLLIATITFGQKYVILDTRLIKPAEFTNTVSIKNTNPNTFAIEKAHMTDIAKCLDGISKMFYLKTNQKDFNYNIGNTNFSGKWLDSKGEKRLDVILFTNCDGYKVPLYLADSKMTNDHNGFFVSTLADYIRNNIK